MSYIIEMLENVSFKFGKVSVIDPNKKASYVLNAVGSSQSYKYVYEPGKGWTEYAV